MNPKRNREKMITTMFEKYGFEGVYIAVQAVLTLYAQGEHHCPPGLNVMVHCRTMLWVMRSLAVTGPPTSL